MRIVNGKAYPTVTPTDVFGFFNEYRCFSNFHLCPVTIDGLTYPSSEHAYMAMKTMDAFQRKHLAFEIEKPGDAKKYGQTVTLREGWSEGLRDTEMERVVYAKFSQNRDIQDVLLATGSKALHETNWWGDKYWGVCEGVGEDKLGRVLMDVRHRIWRENLSNLSTTAAAVMDDHIIPTISEGFLKESTFRWTDYAIINRNHDFHGPDGPLKAFGRCKNNHVVVGCPRDTHVYIDPPDTERMPHSEKTLLMEIDIHPSITDQILEQKMRAFMSDLAQGI